MKSAETLDVKHYNESDILRHFGPAPVSHNIDNEAKAREKLASVYAGKI